MKTSFLSQKGLSVAISGLVFILLATLGWAASVWFSVQLPADPAALRRAIPQTTKIFDREGRLLYEVLASEMGKHTPLQLQDIPLALRQATIATEDSSFYSHPGVDLRAIGRAALWSLRQRRIHSGASTIPQQLARNLLLPPEEARERTLSRKLKEAILALRLSRAYTKDELLALYLNQTYYGNLAWGVEAAARTYFGKSARELDLAEAALLAGLPQAPASLNPLVSPEAARARQRVVLGLMVREGYASQAAAELAAAEPLQYASIPFPIRAPHFVMYVRERLEREYGAEMLARGGLKVYTTLDLDLQEVAEEMIRRHLARLNEPSPTSPAHNVHNAALVALDPHTGQMLAMVGSPDYFDPKISGAVNGALALRQPGSAIKPLTYAAAFEQGLAPATVLADVRTAFLTKEGEPYVPINYDYIYHGPLSLRQALASSSNLAAVKLLDRVGMETLLMMAQRLGITTLTAESRYGLALTLGGGEVSLAELTSAYSVFAAQGRYHEPISILRVEDSGGRILFAWRPEAGRKALDERIAFLITDILADEAARIPSFGEGSVLTLSRPAAAKTGTTSDWRDNWTIGYTPDLVVGVWCGNADGSPMHRVSGVSGAGPIWHDFMERALWSRPASDFVEPPGLTRRVVCAETGKLAAPDCPHRRLEIFIASTEPQEFCTSHRTLAIHRPSGKLAGEGCPAQEVAQQLYFLPGPELQAWAEEVGLPRPPTEYAECRPEGAELPSPSLLPAAREATLAILNPDPNRVLALSPTLPAEAQCIPVAVQVGDGNLRGEVRVLVDGESWASFTSPPFQRMWQLRPGKHTFLAVLEAGGEFKVSEPVSITVLEKESPSPFLRKD